LKPVLKRSGCVRIKRERVGAKILLLMRTFASTLLFDFLAEKRARETERQRERERERKMAEKNFL